MYNGYTPGGVPMPTGNPMQMQMPGQQQQMQQMPGIMNNGMPPPPMPPPLGAMPAVNGGMQGGGPMMGGPAMHLQAMAVNPALQVMYQQYALRWAAMQKMAAETHSNGMMQGMAPGMAPGMMNGGMMNGGMMGHPGQGMPGMIGEQVPVQGMGMHANQGMPGMAPMPMQKPAGNRAPIHTYSSSQGINQQAHTEDPALFYKTRLCHKFRDGHCPFPDCKYAHGEQELRTVEQNQATLQTQQQQQQWGKQQQGAKVPIKAQVPKDTRSALHKTRLCDEFMKTGSCKYSDRCTFAHGEAELRAPPPAIAVPLGARVARGVLWKTQLCDRFMKTGSCSYGDRCTFAHGEVELKRASSQGPTAQQQQQQYKSPGSHPGSASHPGSNGGDNAGSNPSSSGGAHEGQEQEQGSGREGSSGAGDWEQQVQGEGLQQWVGSEQGGEEQTECDDDGGDGYALGVGKRGREEEEAGAGVGEEAGSNTHKRIHVEEEDTGGVEPDCPLCAHLVRQGRNKVVSAISTLDSTQAQQLGSQLLGAASRLDQLWHEVTPDHVTRMLDREEGMSLMDRIDLLHTLAFHTHVTDAAGRTAAGGVGLDSQQYVDQGMPPACADFVWVVMAGREGTASMSEYFSMLEVCRTLYGLTDDTCLSRIMIGL